MLIQFQRSTNTATMFKLVLFLVIYTIVQTKGQLEQNCWATDSVRSPIKVNFASKTPYQPIKGDPSQHNYIPNCTAKKIWFFTRHGTRLPDTKRIERMELFPEIRDSVISNYASGNYPAIGGLCQQDVELINNWDWNTNITSKYEEFLVDQGWDDLVKLAESYKNAFPELIPSKYSREKFNFRFTDTQRTEASFKAFIDGLFGPETWVNFPLPPIPNPDYLLRPHDTCQAWVDHAEVHDGPGTEPDILRDSPPYLNVIQAVSARLGFLGSLLKGKQIRTLFDLCRYEQSWFLNQTSPWCAAFTSQQFRTLNYDRDLESYYKAGHGSEINENLACELVGDLIERLDADDDQNTFYFSHSTTLYLLLVALRVRVDPVPLTTAAYNQLIDDRVWLTSELCPFAANLAFIKYDCPLENDPEKVLILHNERPFEIDWCTNGLCSWSEFKKRYEHFTRGDCLEWYCKK